MDQEAPKPTKDKRTSKLRVLIQVAVSLLCFAAAFLDKVVALLTLCVLGIIAGVLPISDYVTTGKVPHGPLAILATWPDDSVRRKRLSRDPAARDELATSGNAQCPDAKARQAVDYRLHRGHLFQRGMPLGMGTSYIRSLRSTAHDTFLAECWGELSMKQGGSFPCQGAG